MTASQRAAREAAEALRAQDRAANLAPTASLLSDAALEVETLRAIRGFQSRAFVRSLPFAAPLTRAVRRALRGGAS